MKLFTIGARKLSQQTQTAGELGNDSNGNLDYLNDLWKYLR